MITVFYLYLQIVRDGWVAATELPAFSVDM